MDKKNNEETESRRRGEINLDKKGGFTSLSQKNKKNPSVENFTAPCCGVEL
jgi:hypothetical protein